MEVKYYLVHAVNLENKLKKINYHKRENLTEVPAVLQYEKVLSNIDGFELYTNTLNSYIVIQHIDDFDTVEQAEKDYYDENKFEINYNNCLKYFSKKIELINDFDWTALWIVDSKSNSALQVTHGKILSSHYDLYNKYLLLDASFIFQACKQLEKFIHNMTTTSNIHRSTQYLLSFYSNEIFKLAKPKYYLTHENEIKIMTSFYEAWDLQQYIEEVKNKFNQEVTNFSFIWGYNNSKSQKNMNIVLMFIAVVSAYPPIKEVFKDFGKPYLEKIPFYMLIGCSFLILIYTILNNFPPIQIRKKYTNYGNQKPRNVWMKQDRSKQHNNFPR